MAYVRILTKLLRDPDLGRYVVPIIPDEARTFGMEALFRQCGIFSPVGQRYDPVDIGQPAALTARPLTARSCRKESTRPGRWPLSSPPAPR